MIAMIVPDKRRRLIRAVTIRRVRLIFLLDICTNYIKLGVVWVKMDEFFGVFEESCYTLDHDFVVKKGGDRFGDGKLPGVCGG